MNSLLKDTKISFIKGAVVAGTTDQDSSVLDMAGYDNVLFILLTGTALDTGVIELSIYGNTANSTSSPTPTLLTTALQISYTSAGGTDATTKALIADVLRPAQRYVFARCHRTVANLVIQGIVAIQYNARAKPVTVDSTVIANALLGPLA